MAGLLVDNPNWQSFADGLEQDRGLPSGLLAGIMKNETAGGHPDIIGRTSTAGAQGAFQFMPATAKQYNVNVNDTADSTRGAADYLSDLSKKYQDPLLAGAAYNWGPGNVDKAIKAAVGANVPPDALSLANHGFLPKETSAYVVKLAAHMPQGGTPNPAAAADASGGAQPYPPQVIDTTRKIVLQMVQSGQAPASIIAALSKSPVAGMVDHLTSTGSSPDDIISQIGGKDLQNIKDAQSKIDQQGFGTNLMAGASNAVHDLSTGAQQIGATMSGDNAHLAQLNADEATRQADPTNQAQANTAGSMIGNFGVKALPYAAAAMVPELSVPGMIAAQGAAGLASGALKPTTGDGQRLGNTLTEGAIGAGTAGAGALIGKGASALAGKLLSGTPEEAAAVASRAADAKAQGLPVNAATLSGPDGFWRNVSDAMPHNGSVQAFQQKADQAVASKVAEGLGVQGYQGPINTDLLNTARPAIKQALDDATNVSVTLPQSLKADLQSIVGGAKNPLTDGIATSSTVDQAATNLSKAVDAGVPVSGRQLQDLASELKAVARSQTASVSERQVAGQMVGKVNDALTSAMTPEQQTAFTAANSQYAHLKAVEKMVAASGDTGVVSPRQMINAAKTGQFKSSFLKGEAPYQDLAGAASDLYGPSGGRGLGSMLAKASDDHGDHGLTAAIIHPAVGIPAMIARKAGSALLGKMATSENPTLVRLLSGQHSIDPTTAAYIAKALGNAGATSTAS